MNLPVRLAGVFLLLILTGCAGGYSYMLHTDGFLNRSKELKRIVCINPGYHYFDDRDMEDENYLKSKIFQKEVRQDVEAFSKKQGFDYIIKTPLDEGDEKTAFYTRLLPLRRSILQAIRSQDNPLNEIDTRSFSNMSKQVYVVNTLIPAELSVLSKEFGTPYFALYDVYSSAGKTYFVHIIADVTRGRIEYQEVKKLNRSANGRNLGVLIYDSFFFLRENMK